jgi:hypothetical protein
MKYRGNQTDMWDAWYINDKFIVFYTMRDKEKGNQRLGAAMSDDLKEFRIYPYNPVIVPDDRVLLGYENIREYDWNLVDCRDLITVRCKKDGLYYGYFAAAADVGRRQPVGVTAVAVSDDLLNWRDQSIVFVPKQNGMIEVPDIHVEVL